MIQLELQLVGLTKRQCPVCGGGVVGRTDKAYCSRKCKRAAFRQANRERLRAYNKAYHQANREKVLEQKKAYYYANREQCIEKRRVYYQANREQCLERDRGYYHANKEQCLKKQKVYRQANLENVKAREKAYRRANPEVFKAKRHRRRARKKANGVEPTHEHRTTLANPLTRQVCHYCGKDCTEDFHWDHFIPISKGGPDAPWNLVVSCPTCNLSKSDRLPESMFCDELGLVT